MLTSADGEKEYDGTPLTKNAQTDVTVSGDGFVDGEGATYDITGSQTVVGESENTFTYTLNEGTLAENYTIETKNGTLEVTQNKTELKVESADGEWKYDGAEHTKYEYTVTYGEESYTVSVADGATTAVATLANGDKVTITPAADAKVKNFSDSGTENNTFTWTVEHEAGYTKGEDTYGDLSITKRAVTLTSADGEKEYDGTPLTKNAQTDVTVSGDGFVDGEGATYDITGTQTMVGSSENEFTYTLNEGTTASDYTIADPVFGTLTVTKSSKAVTIVSADDSKMYDGKALTAPTYTVKYGDTTVTADEGSDGLVFTLPTGDKLTITDTSKVVHVADTKANNNTFTYVLVNEDQYETVTPTYGTLTITVRTVTMTSATDTKVYDGTALTNSTVTVTGDGFAEGEGATYNVTGTQTLIGSSENTFAYTLNEGTTATDYSISTVNGKLTVTEDTPDNPVEPALVVTKKVDGKTSGYALGEEVTFAITATNIYEKAQTITLSEIEGVTLAKATFENVEGGKTIETTATYTITEADILAGEFTNTVTAKMGKIEKTADATVKTVEPNGHPS